MNNNEQRQEYRLNSHETVFIELASATPDGTEAAEILVSNSVDISANGLQVAVNQPLEIGRILQVSIHLDDLTNPVHLVTEVKWVTHDDNKAHWMVGLALLESDDTRLADWKQLISQRLSGN